jgi:O-antigen/teichoic acid export membrane protein
LINKAVSTARWAIKNGFAHIFSSQVLNKALQFITSIFLVRILSRDTYGTWIYASNTLNMFVLIQGLGLSAGILQFVSKTDDRSEMKSVLLFGLSRGAFINVLLAFLIFSVSFLFPLRISESNQVFRHLLFVPLLIGIFESLQNYFRGSIQNSKYSTYNILNTALFLLFSVFGAIWFGISGLVFSRYASFFFTIAIIVIANLQLFRTHRDSYKIVGTQKRAIFHFSAYSSASGSVSALLFLLDTFLIGLIIAETSIVASYKTATQIPFALTLIPSSIMVFLYPFLVKATRDRKKLLSYLFGVIASLGVLNIIITSLLIIFADFIIVLLFGAEYRDSIAPFRVLAIGYFVTGTFRIPLGNLMSALGKVREGLVLVILSGIINIVLDIVLILAWGSIGAAYATLIVFVFSSVTTSAFLIYIFFKKNEFQKPENIIEGENE